MLKRTVGLIVTGLVVATASPAAATEYQLPNPWLAERVAPMQEPAVDTLPVIAPMGLAALTAGPTLALNAATVLVLVHPQSTHGFSWAYGSIIASPLTLLPGYALAGEPGRGAMVMLGGYLVELAGAVGLAIGLASLQSTGEGGGYAFASGLFLGPLVANTAYALWAASDVHRIAEEKRLAP